MRSFAPDCSRFMLYFVRQDLKRQHIGVLVVHLKKLDGDKNSGGNKTKQSETLPNQNPDHGISSEANATANWHVREIDERHDVRVDEEVVDE